METRGRKPTADKEERSQRLRELRGALRKTQAYLSARAPWYFRNQVWVKCEGGSNAMTSSDAVQALAQVFGVSESEIRDYLAGKIPLVDMLGRVDQALHPAAVDERHLAAERLMRHHGLSEFAAAAIRDDTKWDDEQYKGLTEDKWFKLFQSDMSARLEASVKREKEAPVPKQSTKRAMLLPGHHRKVSSG